MPFLNTKQLSEHISALYNKIERNAKHDSVYLPIEKMVIFSKPEFSYDVSYVYNDANGYNYDFVERGKIRQSYVTKDLFEISYYVLEKCLSPISINFSVLKNKKGSSRPIAFNKRIEYMRIIGEEYAQRCKENVEKILETAPYTEDELLQL
jgi:hypothetical protein